MKKSLLFALAGSLALTDALQAQVVPQQLSYQGHIAVSNTNFTGKGIFKFALVDENGTVSHWSNDGTSAAGAEPTDGVVLPVMGGLYSVGIGNTTLSNMTSVPPQVFTNSNVRLRIWFDDGDNGSQQLNPDQPILSTGYAMMAEQVPDGSITANKIAPGAIDDNSIADGSITAVELAPNSVNTGHIIDGEVNTEDIANLAVSTAKINDAAVTTAKLADNSVNSAKLGDNIDLGSASVTGLLDLWDGFQKVRSIELNGAGHSVKTFGDDGKERTRLHGHTFGELWLHDSEEQNRTVYLTAGNDASLEPKLEIFSARGEDRVELLAGKDSGILSLYGVGGREKQSAGAVLYGNEGNGVGALSLRNMNGSPRLRLYGGPSGRMMLYNDAGQLNLWGYSYDGEEGTLSVRNKLGNETIYLWGRNSQDNSGGQIGLKKSNGTETVTINADANGGPSMVLRNGAGEVNLWGYSYENEEGTLSVRNKFGNETIYLWGRNSQDSNGGQIGLKNNIGVQTITLNADHNGEGRITTQVLQITGGSDLSEQFNVNEDGLALEPGMVVSIDPENPGELRISDRAYDATVAGVISGAGGVKPGMLMGQTGSVADGDHPVALTGRVYCHVDAGFGAIKPGDLITTSDTPGHGMKVSDPARAQGTILGKAMTSLESGRGLVLVLVSLQ